MGLEELCKVFNVKGKIHSYKKSYNDLKILSNEVELKNLLDYNIQDCKALFQALESAQHTYLRLYKTDIASVLSTSSLALKIFRTVFQKINIPILNKSVDSFIRKSYFGGATDIYLNKIEDAQYVDKNSLYPDAMTRPIPINGKKLDKLKT